MRKIRNTIAALLITLASIASAQVPVIRWDVETGRMTPVPYDLTIRRGESVNLQPRFLSYGNPIAISSNAVIEWRCGPTNVSGAYITNPVSASVVAGMTGRVNVAFGPWVEPSNDITRYEISVSGTLIRAYGQLTMLAGVGDPGGGVWPTGQVSAATYNVLNPRLTIVENTLAGIGTGSVDIVARAMADNASNRINGIAAIETNLFIGASDPRMVDARAPLAHTQDVSTVTGALTAGDLVNGTNLLAVDLLGKVPSTNGLESVAAAVVRTNAVAQDIVAKIPSVAGLVSNGTVTIAAGANVTVNGGASATLTNGATITIASSGGGGGTGDYASVDAILAASGRVDTLEAVTITNYSDAVLSTLAIMVDDINTNVLLATGNPTPDITGIWTNTGMTSDNANVYAQGSYCCWFVETNPAPYGVWMIGNTFNPANIVSSDPWPNGWIKTGALRNGNPSGPYTNNPSASGSIVIAYTTGRVSRVVADHRGLYALTNAAAFASVGDLAAVELSSVSHDFMQDIRLALIDNRDIYNADEGPVVTFATSMGGINLAESTNYFYSASAKYCANYVTNGNCVRMDRTNDYIQLSGDIGNYTNNFSVSMWVRLHSTASSQQLISRGAWGAGAHSQWLIHWASNDRLYFGTNSGGGAYVTSSGLNNTNWHHIAWTINGQSTNQAIYIDGVRKAVGGTTTPVEMSITSAAPVVIGAARFGTTNLSPAGAFFDEVLIWNREITSNEQYALYNSGIGRYTYTNDAVASNLVAMYHLDDNGTSTNAIDSGPLQWPAATLNNGPTWAAGERANKDEAVSMRLTLTNYAAQTTLDNGFAMVAVEPINSINSAADLNLYVSRDGGTSSNKVTLTHDGKWDSGTRGIFVGSFDASTQPAGTNWVLRYITSTNRMNTYGLGIQLK